jgi:hypothetical protein
MVVWAEVGDGADEGVLIAGLRSWLGRSSGGGLLGDVVDAVVLVLVGLAVGVHHGGLVPLTGEAVLLEMAFLLAISAGSIGVSDGSGGAGLVVGDAFLLEAKDSELAKLVIR